MKGAWRLFRRVGADRNGRLGLFFTALTLVFAFAAPLAAPDPNRIDIKARFEAPNIVHPLGTDALGRDLVARVATGTRTALSYAVAIVASSALLGSLIGVVAGSAGGWTDRAVLALFDIVSAFPALILAFALVALYGTGPLTFVGLVTVIFIPQFGRMARSRALALNNQSFVEAERLLGVHPLTILLRHMLPNVAGPIIVLASMNIPAVITFEAGLSFLGLGVQPPASSLGTLIKDGFVYLNQSFWPTLDAAIVLAVATLGSTLFGEALRRVLDPKAEGVRS